MVQPKKQLSWSRGWWLLLLPLPVLWSLAHHFGWLKFFESRTVDWRFQHRGEIAAPITIIYVDVDSSSIDAIGNWPWTRQFHARVIDALVNTAGVKAIGFDFVFSPTGHAQSADKRLLRAGDIELSKLIFKLPPEQPPPAVFAASFSAREFRAAEGVVRQRGLPLVARDPRPVSEIEPPEQTSIELGNGATAFPPNLGLIDTIDGGTRTVAAWTPTQTREFNHLAIELARLYWGLPPEGIKRVDDRIDFVSADGVAIASIPLREKQLVDINWFSPWQSEQDINVSFVEVFKYAEFLKSTDSEERALAEEFFGQDDWKNAVVLIGPVDPLLQDLATTPFDDSPVPKVSVHGNLLKTIVTGLYLKRTAPWAEHALIFGLTFLVSTLAAAGGRRGLRSKLTAVLLLVGYVVAAFHVFGRFHLVLPLAAPLGAVLTTSLAAISWQLMQEEKAKGRIKGMFGAYVSPQLVNRMVETGEDPQLGGHDSEITAYFSDIQGFSTFSEKLKSGPLVELMNEYLTACTDIVQEEGGTLDKYIGDAVVAMFGAPIPMADHAYRACVATQRVHAKLGELREKWRAEGDKWPEIVWKMQSRIGLNTGVCMIGNMGSRTRFNYTMMGDDVNLAARMESGAKSWGSYTMCTQTTKDACQKHGGDRVVFRSLGRIVVKGRTLAVPIFEIVGLKETVTAQTRECIAIFERAMERYYARDWDGARELFAQSRELELNVPGKTPGVVSNPSIVYLEKVIPEAIEEPPPADWDGRYVMKEK